MIRKMSLAAKCTSVALAFFLAVCAGSIILTHRKAKILLEDVENLSTSPSPGSSFQSFRKKYGAQFRLETCGPDTYTRQPSMKACGYTVHLSNRLLSRLHLVHETDLDVGFVEVGGSLVQVSVEYASGNYRPDRACSDYVAGIFKTSSPCVSIEEDFCPDSLGPGGVFIPSNGETGTEPWAPCRGIRVQPSGSDKTPNFYGVVNLGYWTREEEKRAALAFNLNCLFSIRGCNDISELLPTIWDHSNDGKVSSRY